MKLDALPARRSFLLLACCALLFGCNGGGPGTDGIVAVGFTPVGATFGQIDLIDIEFLPGSDGDAIVIAKSGTVFYMKADFTLLAANAAIEVQDAGEQGLLNVAVDPDYADNRFIYFYFTSPDGSQNQVDRFTVSATPALGSFSLSDRQTIIAMPKSESPAPGSNHNGGAMLFDAGGNLMLGVGDGGGTASADASVAVSQNPAVRLGKILRIVPSRVDGSGGFAIPAGGNGGPAGALPEIYALGLRNPFTAAISAQGLFVGDVGGSLYEEIDLAQTGGQNFGWPLSEGPTDDPRFTSPILSYRHDDPAFPDEDPLDNPTGPQAVIVCAFYDGSAYGGQLSGRLIYAEFYMSWVRSFEASAGSAVDDMHLGHQAGLTSMQEGPNGVLYAVSLFGSDRILRVDVE